MKWFLFKMLFRKSGLSRALKKHNQAELQKMQQKALAQERYELAALLSYYLQFKFDKNGKRNNHSVPL